jgi:hypothetical protein
MGLDCGKTIKAFAATSTSSGSRETAAQEGCRPELSPMWKVFVQIDDASMLHKGVVPSAHFSHIGIGEIDS